MSLARGQPAVELDSELFHAARRTVIHRGTVTGAKPLSTEAFSLGRTFALSAR